MPICSTPRWAARGATGLATKLGARCTAVATLIVDGHRQTSVDGLYAIGDVVSGLHQITVGDRSCGGGRLRHP